ncbi:MAG: hypothetical protein K5745_03945 [Saccharofermentans sp.]|nr:hypothetical protein [Saccharofermentans sp.]
MRKATMNKTEDTKAITLVDMNEVVGGTAFTVGTYGFNRQFTHPEDCPKCYEPGYYTGRGRENYFLFGLFSKHQGEFRCDRCNYTWWVNGELS